MEKERLESMRTALEAIAEIANTDQKIIFRDTLVLCIAIAKIELEKDARLAKAFANPQFLAKE